MAQKYNGKVEFVFVYCRETHPEGKGDMNVRSMYPAYADLPPLTQTRCREERQARAELFRAKTNSQRRILVDEDGDDSVWRRYGSGEDLTVVVGSDGKIVWRACRSMAPALDAYLGRLLEESTASSQRMTPTISWASLLARRFFRHDGDDFRSYSKRGYGTLAPSPRRVRSG